jgi:hypothetical protein
MILKKLDDGKDSPDSPWTMHKAIILSIDGFGRVIKEYEYHDVFCTGGGQSKSEYQKIIDSRTEDLTNLLMSLEYSDREEIINKYTENKHTHKKIKEVLESVRNTKDKNHD